jgi:hypothetical protein
MPSKLDTKRKSCATKQEGILGAMPIQSADQASLWATPIPALTNSLLKLGKQYFSQEETCFHLILFLVYSDFSTLINQRVLNPSQSAYSHQSTSSKSITVGLPCRLLPRR